jgi:hypothetical protein
MREITLKELAAYLPYNAKARIYSVDNTSAILKLTTDFIYSWELHDFKIKPILRPITDVENDIIHNGKTVNVLDIMNGFWGVEWLGATEEFELPEVYGRNIILSPEDLPYDLFQVLLEYHFDVFGLIEDNLAIPVTNEFNPYN